MSKRFPQKITMCVAFGLSVFVEVVMTPQEVEGVQKGNKLGTNPRAL